jgi:hypothetical protein
VEARADTDFVLLGDQPDIEGRDPLGFDDIVSDLTSLILASRDSTPFTIGIEAAWGMGKSSLMGRLCAALTEHEDITSVTFNAWTADDGTVLEGLIKSVLEELDPNALRRALRNRRLVGGARFAFGLAAGYLGLGSVVDSVWKRVGVDPQARNELRNLVEQAVGEWRDRRPDQPRGRLLCVFVDDLDRCSPGGVLDVFEAMKLYLDVPGIVFVVGYDEGIVSELILQKQGYDEAVRSRDYLEKFIQIVYRIPFARPDRSDALLKSLLESSATGALFGPTEREVVIRGSESNPRRLKRFINSFVLAYGMDSRWQEFSPEGLVRVQLLQMYFRDFAALLERSPEKDPVEEFLKYRTARDGLRGAEEGAAGKATELLESYGIAGPGSSARSEEFPELVKRLDDNVPEVFVPLVRRDDFFALVESLAAGSDWAKLRSALAEGALSMAQGDSHGTDIGLDAADETLKGVRILWVDDHHENNGPLQQALLRKGADLWLAGYTEQMNLVLDKDKTDVLISDIDRDENPEEGFDAIEARYHEHKSVPPMIFYAGRITAARKRRAAELEAPVVDDPDRLIALLETSAQMVSGLAARSSES